MYYFHALSRSLVYLENVRNDAVIEYDARPHEAREDSIIDVAEVVDLIEYILAQERAEFEYIKEREKAVPEGRILERYFRTIPKEPFCLQMLMSVERRLWMLVERAGAQDAEAVRQLDERIGAIALSPESTINQPSAQRASQMRIILSFSLCMPGVLTNVAARAEYRDPRKSPAQ